MCESSSAGVMRVQSDQIYYMSIIFLRKKSKGILHPFPHDHPTCHVLLPMLCTLRVVCWASGPLGALDLVYSQLFLFTCNQRSHWRHAILDLRVRGQRPYKGREGPAEPATVAQVTGSGCPWSRDSAHGPWQNSPGRRLKPLSD